MATALGLVWLVTISVPQPPRQPQLQIKLDSDVRGRPENFVGKRPHSPRMIAPIRSNNANPWWDWGTPRLLLDSKNHLQRDVP